MMQVINLIEISRQKFEKIERVFLSRGNFLKMLQLNRDVRLVGQIKSSVDTGLK